MHNSVIDYSWEDQVNAKVNDIILKLFKEKYPDRVKLIKELVKTHLESQ